MSPKAKTSVKTSSAAAAGSKVAARVLHLTNPLMTGDDVKLAQSLLAANPYGSFGPGAPDGEYGPGTAAATKQAKWALGYADANCDTAFGPKLLGILQGDPLPSDFEARREVRKHTVAQHGSIREKIVANARWGIENEPQIHYDQTRPIDGHEHPFKLPLRTDCSGFVTLCYEWAGGSDPNGLAFSGLGYTGSLLTACQHIAKGAVQAGDLVIWGPSPGHHAALVLEPGDDPLLASHGQEKGPVAVRFSVETQYQPGPVTWLSCLV
jgi:hypothetical protein